MTLGLVVCFLYIGTYKEIMPEGMSRCELAEREVLCSLNFHALRDTHTHTNT
jgi:hypothetical protein